ncbi:hypothetical protein GUJ93_ZPchr0010g9335 [Zizania palustris]|uniref:Uncharacterized protein n=1 Tax=Zizania palustris TaxID=103762 RepID=A0A8J5W6D5_ZIZPA|nr:hypothetical protein GUJ93_ZPchr0010g9335 [Zizania palustris]
MSAPRRAARSCTRRPMAVAHRSSHRSVSLATAPAWRSPSSFPGSRNTMLIRNPGPVKSHSFRHENGRALEQDAAAAATEDGARESCPRTHFPHPGGVESAAGRHGGGGREPGKRGGEARRRRRKT